MRAGLLMGLVGALFCGSGVAHGDDRAIPRVEPTERTDFCGPAFFQYSVHSERGRVGEGIRCVRFDGKRMAWYGEGRWWDTGTYRHIGAAEFEHARHAHGAAAAIGSNDANAGRAFDGSLKFDFTYADDAVPVIIHENGTWNETWRLDALSQYVNPVPHADEPCASSALLTAYEVTSPGQREAKRCIPKVGLPVWYGQGKWLGKRYMQLGMLDEAQNWSTPGNLYGAIYGICGGQMMCDVLRPVEFTRVVDGSLIITGEVNENWRPTTNVN